ncbi:agamous-like MADS-box protein AGL29 [Salvia divinorum]|uniref:Agamous-like MADS-box protein AGL29 n=1 Tax=Salvia divinorum TaxID=28513 RepID=A0ABD1FKK5_SALDI
MPRLKHTRGRQRIPIQLIPNQDDLYACFSKRRYGLFKKASELSTLCGADIGVVVFSPTVNPFSFFSPSMDSVLDRFQNPGQQPLRHSAWGIDFHARACVRAHNKCLDGLLQEKLRLQEYQRRVDEADQARAKAWWEETAVEGLDKERVREWMAWFGDFKARVEGKVAEIRNGASCSNSAYGAGHLMDQFCNFPAAAYVDHSGGGVIGQHYYPSLCFPSNNLTAGEEEAAAAANQGGNQFF